MENKTNSKWFTSKKWKNNGNYKTKPYKTVKTETDPWLDGTFAIDPLTWKCKHIPKNDSQQSK